MINLYEKGRIPSEEKEILTKSFLIDKIANDMKLKYKKVLSFINYDEHSLKNDIHFLLSKYISNNKKEINIKYIETTLLNKVREKYRRKSPFKWSNNNLYDKPDKNLIKIVNSSSKKNIYIKKEVKKDDKLKNILPVINNNNNCFYRNSNYKDAYSKTYENKKSNENINENINDVNNINNMKEISDIDKKINNLLNEEKNMQEEIKNEKNEILQLEEYKKSIQQQIDEINKEIQKENESLKKELLNNSNNNIPDHNNEHSNEKENKNEEFINGISNWAYNPSMSFDQMKYLERRQAIEEDCYNKENKYIFLKNRNTIDNDNPIRHTPIPSPFKYNNIKINSYSKDNIKKIYEKNKNENIPKDNNNKNENNRYQKNTYTFSDFISHENLMKSQENKKMDTIIPYEEKMQLKILQRSIAQEKAFNHLRRILSPEKEYLNESNYQGFNNNNSESDFDKKRKELEIADKARKIQVEKMKKLLDESIIEREKRKMAEKEFDKKYREMNEREYESYRERETKKKMVKNQKMQNYRKMLDEQIEQKKKLMFKNDMNNQPFSLEMFS